MKFARAGFRDDTASVQLSQPANGPTACAENRCVEARCNKDAKFAAAARCLGKLSFVPPKHVARVFEESQWPTDELFAKLARYFNV